MRLTALFVSVGMMGLLFIAALSEQRQAAEPVADANNASAVFNQTGGVFDVGLHVGLQAWPLLLIAAGVIASMFYLWGSTSR